MIRFPDGSPLRDRWPRLCSMAADLMLLGVGNRAVAPATPSYVVQEIDGVSRFTLEDSSGSLLLE
jgi:hypothetical protein